MIRSMLTIQLFLHFLVSGLQENRVDPTILSAPFSKSPLNMWIQRDQVDLCFLIPKLYAAGIGIVLVHIFGQRPVRR